MWRSPYSPTETSFSRHHTHHHHIHHHTQDTAHSPWPWHRTLLNHGRRCQQRYLWPHTSYPSNCLFADRLRNRLQGNAKIVENGMIFTKFWTSKSWWLNSSSPPQYCNRHQMGPSGWETCGNSRRFHQSHILIDTFIWSAVSKWEDMVGFEPGASLHPGS